ncbi:FAD-dependent oxidoreductase [Roseomonas sp. NAR14]|uniref:Tryptophan 2-monooxygenase n=1 Tax=Roseomonas acroporae TaxID=2937791 RepID=A0A9X1Y907_9PROT|nr:FAD-dependent oxidoreductase [Roseomonas acroporae]MCK8785661.1 FAD-dependent oxidoreductase [Roseomonas acroporae]
MTATTDLPDLDVAIVGGGVSGLYAGWRLLTAPPDDTTPPGAWARAAGGRLRVTLFEGSDRVGGRLLSATSPHLPGTVCEIGGMRYVHPDQKLVAGLVETVLKLPYHAQTVDRDENIAFLRGRLLRSRDLGTPGLLPYHLDQAEASWLAARPGGAPAAMIGRVLKALLPGLEAARATGRLREFLATAEVDGLALHKHGFWNLLARGMSPDAYQAARATIGYDCLGGNTNAADLAAEYFDFGKDVEYRMLDDGYERLPWELRGLLERAGGGVELGRWLGGFEAAPLADGSTGVRLHFLDGGPVTARALILAMPRRSLELLRRAGPVLDDDAVRARLGTVTPVPLYKLFLVYQEPWWQQAGVSRGRSLTDLPLRQCYYWPTDPRACPAATGPAAIMAYNDLLNVSFWAGLRTLPDPSRPSLHPRTARRYAAARQAGAATPHFGRAAAPQPLAAADDAFAGQLRRNWQQHDASERMVAEMHRQLRQMHGVDDAPGPIDAAFADWADDPYGGGVHLWNVGLPSGEVEQDMTQPRPGFPCYVCGEAYSTRQTWVEGALRTAEIVLQRRLGLPAPAWAPEAIR